MIHYKWLVGSRLLHFTIYAASAAATAKASARHSYNRISHATIQHWRRGTTTTAAAAAETSPNTNAAINKALLSLEIQ